MDWIELLNSALTTIIPALATLLAAWFAVLGTKLKAKYDQKINNDTAKAVVADVVQFVQQVYKDLDGDAKLKKAVEEASTILQSKGIKITETEINMLIESAVFSMKQSFIKDTTNISIDNSTNCETDTIIEDDGNGEEN